MGITGNYLGWRGGLWWNRSDFYDLFGPTKRSLKGFAAKLGYTKWLVWDEPKTLNITYDLAYYDGIDTLPGAQNVATSFTRLTTAEARDPFERRAAIDRRGRCREGRKLGRRADRELRQRSDHHAGPRQLRFRLAAPDPALVHLAAQRRRRRQRRSQQRRSRTSTSAASATIMSTPGPFSAIANTTRCRVSASMR